MPRAFREGTLRPMSGLADEFKVTAWQAAEKHAQAEGKPVSARYVEMAVSARLHRALTDRHWRRSDSAAGASSHDHHERAARN
jgi:hypothetical protein